MIGIVLFGVLAATRTIWQNPADLTYLQKYIPKLDVLPKEKSVAYEKACASCHMAYAPSMLPARSWKKIMTGLDYHFGDNAEVEPQIEKEISDYLQRNAADQVENVYAQPMLKLLKADDVPLRLSDTKYFKLRHDVVKAEMVTGNPEVMSVARCDVCHHEALDGRFNKFNVRIPNYIHPEGRWLRVMEEKENL